MLLVPKMLAARTQTDRCQIWYNISASWYIVSPHSYCNIPVCWYIVTPLGFRSSEDKIMISTCPHTKYWPKIQCMLVIPSLSTGICSILFCFSNQLLQPIAPFSPHLGTPLSQKLSNTATRSAWEELSKQGGQKKLNSNRAWSVARDFSVCPACLRKLQYCRNMSETKIIHFIIYK